MIAGSSGSFKDSMWLVYLKKAWIFEFFYIKNVIDLNFETQVFIELLNENLNRIWFNFLLNKCCLRIAIIMQWGHAVGVLNKCWLEQVKLKLYNILQSY